MSRLRPVLLLVASALLPWPTLGDEPAIAARLRPFVESGKLPGAVTLVANPEGVLDLQAVGYSDIAAKSPMKPDALFWIASMNKPITVTALMMLVDEGKIKLDDPVEKYLPEFRGQMVQVEKSAGGDLVILKKPPHPINVREILSHTSGLVNRSPLEKTLDSVSLREGAISYALSPLTFVPGAKYSYCNPGINTAGRLIEVVSGMPYEQFLQQRLLDPLGMKDTTFWPDESQLQRLAKSYKYQGPADKGAWEETTVTQLAYPLTDRNRHPYPAGGLFSTATDLSRFCRMILGGGTLDGRRYLSEAAVREMTSTQTGDLNNGGGRVEGGYGLGWSTSRRSRGADGPVIPGHCGHGGAYATSMDVDPETKLVTVYLVQCAGGLPDFGKAQKAFEEAAKETFGKQK